MINSGEMNLPAVLEMARRLGNLERSLCQKGPLVGQLALVGHSVCWYTQNEETGSLEQPASITSHALVLGVAYKGRRLK
jgi:hypothetical protein